MSHQQNRIILLLAAAAILIMLCAVTTTGSFYLIQRFLGPGLAMRNQPVDSSRNEQLPLSQEGLLVVALDPDGAAAEAGLRRGNIILEIDGSRVDQPQQLQRALQAYRSGDQFTLRVLDGRETTDVVVTLRGPVPKLGARVIGSVEAVAAPEVPARPPGGEPTRPPATPDPFSPGGVPARPFMLLNRALVAGLSEGGPAAEAGLQAGDIITNLNGAAILTSQELIETIRGFAPNDVVELTVRRGDETLSFRIRLAEHPDDSSRGFLGIDLDSRR